MHGWPGLADGLRDRRGPMLAGHDACGCATGGGYCAGAGGRRDRCCRASGIGDRPPLTPRSRARHRERRAAATLRRGIALSAALGYVSRPCLRAVRRATPTLRVRGAIVAAPSPARARGTAAHGAARTRGGVPRALTLAGIGLDAADEPSTSSSSAPPAPARARRSARCSAAALARGRPRGHRRSGRRLSRAFLRRGAAAM